MAFFDDIKRSATDLAGKVAKKTSGIASITKVSVNIKAAETKLNSIFEEIGYLFYTAQRNGVDKTEEIAAEILKADAVVVELNDLKKESARLRNVTVCPECNAEIEADASFCPKCGHKKEVEEPETAEDAPDEACECTCEECNCEDEGSDE